VQQITPEEEEGIEKESGMGLASTPNEVPSNFTAMVVHMFTAAVSSTCSLLLRTSAGAALECRQCNPDSLRK